MRSGKKIMQFHFKLNNGKVVTLGTLLKVHKDSLKQYVKQYPIHWITV